MPFTILKSQPRTRVPRNIYRDDETVQREALSPSEWYREWQLHSERHSIPEGREADPHYIYNLENAERDMQYIYNHLLESERIKAQLLRSPEKVIEYYVWHHTPLNELAGIFGRRIWPGLMVAAEVTGDWVLASDMLEWFTTQWLPRADAVASIMRTLDRVHSRTRPVADICLPMMDEFKDKFYSMVNYLRDEYPDLPLRVKN